MAREIKQFMWSLCEECTVRNCHKTPKEKTNGYYCNKRRAYKSGSKLGDRLDADTLLKIKGEVK